VAGGSVGIKILRGVAIFMTKNKGREGKEFLYDKGGGGETI